MSFPKKILTPPSPGAAPSPISESMAEEIKTLPETVGEVNALVKTPEIAKKLFSLIKGGASQTASWAGRLPVCADALVKILFSATKFTQVLAPFFSLCLEDPSLKKALLRVASDGQGGVIQGTLEEHIQAIAENPEIFFDLGTELINKKNQNLFFSLLNYCDKNPDFVKSNTDKFSELINGVVIIEDVVVLEHFFDKNLDRFLDYQGEHGENFLAAHGGLRVEDLVSRKQWKVLDLLIQKGKMSTMVISACSLYKGEHPEKISLLLANGAIVRRPSPHAHLEKGGGGHIDAYTRYQMHQQLHSADLSEDHLRAQDSTKLWNWFTLDHGAASVVLKYPSFFKTFFLKMCGDQTESTPAFSSGFCRALSILIATNNFDLVKDGVPLLFSAISLNYSEWVKILIEQGVSMAATHPETGFSTLEAAVRALQREPAPDLELCHLFLNCSALEGWQHFTNGSHPIDLLFESNALNKHVLLEAMFEKGRGLLQGLKLSLLSQTSSLQLCDVPALNVLISQGISVGDLNPGENSLLHVLITRCFTFKSSQQQFEGFLSLIRHVAIYHAKDFDGLTSVEGKTALDLAQSLDLPEVALILLQAGIVKEAEPQPQPSINPLWRSIKGAYGDPALPLSSQDLQPWLTFTNLWYFFSDALEGYGEIATGSRKDFVKKEGNSFSDSATFLSTLLSMCDNLVHDHYYSMDEAKKIGLVRGLLRGAISCSKTLDACMQDPLFQRRFLPVISSCIETQIAALPPGESLLIPSGWMGSVGGHHSMIVEVQKEGDGRCSLFVINTDNGNGAKLHGVYPTGLKDLINPVRVFARIPQKKLLDSSLIPTLLSLRAHVPKEKGDKYRAKDLYDAVFWRFGDYATPLPQDEKGCFITPQRSGSCTMRCVFEHLRWVFGARLYAKVMMMMEERIFRAMNDVTFIEQSSQAPDFFEHIEHATERAALRLNRSRISGLSSLTLIEKRVKLLQEVNDKLAKVKKTNKALSRQEKEEEVENLVTLSLLQLAIAALEEGRKTLLPLQIERKSLIPCPVAPLPQIDFATLDSKEGWIQGIDELILFFEKSVGSPLDPDQTVATCLTTQAIMQLALPGKGVFLPSVDEGLLIGSLSLEEKKGFREKIGTLCQKYATALYNQRRSAAKKEAGHWMSAFDEPEIEAESVEQYLCINKLFAYYWRLSLALDSQGEGSLSLCHFGIDIFHLEALRESIHLPCYSPQTAEQLDGLIAFFKESHPAPSVMDRTLFAIGFWSTSGRNTSLPLESAPSAFGDALFCAECYHRIPEEYWNFVDKQREFLQTKALREGGVSEIDPKKWRLSYLFADPEMSQILPEGISLKSEHGKSVQSRLKLYAELRKMAFTCWLFKRASFEVPIRYEKIRIEGREILTKLVAEPAGKELEAKAKESQDPFHVGKLGHRSFFLGQEALKHLAQQNDYTIQNGRAAKVDLSRFYEIAQAEDLSIHRLLTFYEENISRLKQEVDQIFFQLILFGKKRLAKALNQDPLIGERLLHLTERALQEFDLQLHLSPTKVDLLQAILFLSGIRLRLGNYLPEIFSEEKRRDLQEEISLRSRSLPTSTAAPRTEAELLLLWICAQPRSEWAGPSCERALVHLCSLQRLEQKLIASNDPIDPTLRALADLSLFTHLNDLTKAFEEPGALRRVGEEICRVYGINIGSETAFQGAFPQLFFIHQGSLYEIHLLSGCIVRDKVLLESLAAGLPLCVREAFLNGRGAPIEEVFILHKEENSGAVGFHVRSGGNDYYATFERGQEMDSKKMQLEWIRGGREPFRYLPFNEVPDELKRIALPSPLKADHYYYWTCRGTSNVAAIIQNRKTGIEEVIVYADGTAERVSEEGRWHHVLVESIPELSPLVSMQSKEQIAVWEKADGLAVRKVYCFGLRDPSGAPLTLQKDSPSGFWKVDNLPGYRLCDDQTLKRLSRQFPYLVVENEKGEKKALLAVITWSEIASQSQDGQRSYAYEEISIDEKGYPIVSEIFQHLLLAYYFIGAKRYDLALGSLSQAESYRVYTPEELKMLGWIFLHFEETCDMSPKAVALSLMAARLSSQNLEKFPDAYSLPSPLQKKMTCFYDEPKSWPGFWKGNALWPKGEEKHLMNVHASLGVILARYYEVSSHCPDAFQLKKEQLTAFQEADWLAEIIPHAEPSCRSLLTHRLYFLLKGQPHPPLSEMPPAFEISFKFNSSTEGFPWLHSIDVKEDALRSVLSCLNRVRPEKGFAAAFGKLYALATRGTQEERAQLLIFLKDMQWDPSEENQIIRAILMSQLPPYNTAPAFSSSDLSSYSKTLKTVPEAIAEKVCSMAKARQKEDGETLYDYGQVRSRREEEWLLSQMGRWKDHFFPSPKKEIKPKELDVYLAPLLPPLSQEKKPLLEVALQCSDALLEEMHAAAEALFLSEEKELNCLQFPPLPKALQKDPYFQMRAEALRKDIEEGSVQNSAKRHFCLKKEVGLQQLKLLQKNLGKRKDQLKGDLKGKREKIDLLVRKVRGESSRAIQAQLLRLGKKEVPPSLDECIALFVQRDLTLYQQRLPFLSKEDCLQLDQMIGDYLLLATTKQRVKRSLEKLTQVVTGLEKGKHLKQRIHDLALEMQKKREFSPSKNPQMLVFEYYADLSLRKEQCDNLMELTTVDAQGNFPTRLLQMIMNAGKTSVLGTLLALIKADGYHLSMLFTPRSLLNTNAPEMGKRNQEFFGQRGHTLTFNRGEAYFNTKHLRRVHHLLLCVIQRREYVILAPETLLSMQNQYIAARDRVDTLRQQQKGVSSGKKGSLQKEIEKWEAPAQVLKQILHLIYKRWAPTFDEIDAQFSPRKELNYPGVETIRLDRLSIELVTTLYGVAATDPDLREIGLNLPENTQARLVPIPGKIAAIRHLLAKKMLEVIKTHPTWWDSLGLHSGLEEGQSAELMHYFSNPAVKAPEWIVKLSGAGSREEWMAAERLTLIRQEILQWLPSCWGYSAEEHFSRSKENPNYLAAKPNICANKPNESAEIAHPWELINKTLQLYVSTGVDLKQTGTIVESLQKLAMIQLRNQGINLREKGNKSLLESTPIVQQFKRVVKEGGFQLDLMSLNTEDEEAMGQVQKMLNAKNAEATAMIIQYLNDQVFSHLEFHKNQIHNCAANLVGEGDSEQGYSGTPDNPFVCSHGYMRGSQEKRILRGSSDGYLRPDPPENPCIGASVHQEKRIILDGGAYGRVIETLCRTSRALHIAPSEIKTPEALMKKLHETKPLEERERFHAFIDIGAYFKGHTNAEVAASFLSYFSSLAESSICGILYYDDATNQLACLKKGSQEAILLNATDAETIFARTGLKKHQLFTVFDPAHCVGANIIQKRGAKAFYTVGDLTSLRDMLQGVMRMRGLLEEQEVEGIIPEGLIPLIFHQIQRRVAGIPSIEQILLFCEVNGLFRDREDNLKAFSLKLSAAVRKYVLGQLYSQEIREEEEALYAVASPFFMKSMTEELFCAYGGVPEAIGIDLYIEKQLQDLFCKIEPIAPYLPADKLALLKKEIEEIAQISRGYLPSAIETLSLAENSTVENVTDVDRKVDHLSELDLDLQKHLGAREQPKSAQEILWGRESAEILLQELFGLSIEPRYQSLCQAMCANGQSALFADCFTPEFLVSNNFIQTVLSQSNLFDKFQKTPYEAFLFKHPDQRYRLLLLSTKEAEYFLHLTEGYKDKLPFSLLNADGSLRSGAAIDPSHPEIEQLIIQMLFFSGRLPLLEQEKLRAGLLKYLSLNLAMKRTFFEDVILEVGKFADYEHSTLKQMLHARSLACSTDPVLMELAGVSFALHRGRSWLECRSRVEKHLDSIVKGDPKHLLIVIAIAINVAERSKSSIPSLWAEGLLIQILPCVQKERETHPFPLISKMLESLDAPISHEVKTQIIQAAMQVEQLPVSLLLKMIRSSFPSIIDETTEVDTVVQALERVAELLNPLQKNPNFDALIAAEGEFLISVSLPKGGELRYAEEKEFIRAQIVFEAIRRKLDFVHFCAPPAGRDALMRNFNSREGLFKPIPGIKIAPEGISIQQEGHKNVQSRAKLSQGDSEALVKYVKPFLEKYLTSISAIGSQLIRFNQWTKFPASSPTEQRGLQFYAEIKNCWNIHPLLTQMVDNYLIQPIIKEAHRSDTEGAHYWKASVEALESMQIPSVTEQAQNLRLKFTREWD